MTLTRFLFFILCFNSIVGEVMAAPKTSVQKKGNISNEKRVSNIEKILKLLDKARFGSKKYNRFVNKLENFYSEKASLESLKIIVHLYKDKKDEDNEEKILKKMILYYPEDPTGHYLLGAFYKGKYEAIIKTKPYCKSSQFAEEKRDMWAFKAIDNLSTAIKIIKKDRPFKKAKMAELAYVDLLLLMKKIRKQGVFVQEGSSSKASDKKKSSTKNSEVKEELALPSTLEILNLVKDMNSYFDKRYLVELCEAYNDQGFIIQTFKACKQALKANPNVPEPYLLYVLRQSKKERIPSDLIKLAKKFSNSDYVLFHVGKFFLNVNMELAKKYLIEALKQRRRFSFKSDNGEIQNDLAQIFFKEANMEEALKYFKQACESDIQYLKSFKNATNRLFYIKGGDDWKGRFQSGVEDCFNKFNKKKKICS